MTVSVNCSLRKSFILCIVLRFTCLPCLMWRIILRDNPVGLLILRSEKPRRARRVSGSGDDPSIYIYLSVEVRFVIYLASLLIETLIFPLVRTYVRERSQIMPERKDGNCAPGEGRSQSENENGKRKPGWPSRGSFRFTFTVGPHAAGQSLFVQAPVIF